MDIYKALKRVFGTGLIVNDVKGDKIKVIDTQRSQAYARANTFISKLRKNSLYQTTLQQNYSINRLALYRDYDMMDADPYISSALDIYVFESLTKDEYGQTLKITCQDEDITELLEELFYERLNCEFNFPIWFRNFTKYGDFFLALKLHDTLGIIGGEPLSSYDLQRVEDDPDRPGAYYFKFYAGGNEIIQNYNIAHFRLLNDSNFLPYGRSTLQPARRIWKNLTLMIDAMMIQRIMRAPQRRVFKIDTGDLSKEQVQPYMRDVINKMQKVPYKDPNTGQINLKYNIQNLLEDFFIPVRGKEDGSSVETLAGMQNSFTDDIQFLFKYLRTALKIPNAFLNDEQGIEAKATLAGLDIIFARYVETLQNIFISQLYRVALIHLFMNGYTDLGDIDFKLELNNPSNVKKIQQIQLWNQLVDLGIKMQESSHFSLNFIYDEIYNIPGDRATLMLKQIKSDRKYKAQLQALQQEVMGGGEEQYAQEEEEAPEEYQETTQSEPAQQQAQSVEPEEYQEQPLTNNFRGNSPLNLD